jgi:hypothetical protein
MTQMCSFQVMFTNTRSNIFGDLVSNKQLYLFKIRAIDELREQQQQQAVKQSDWMVNKKFSPYFKSAHGIEGAPSL